MIHRDIKPSNILVTSRDGVPVPKVIDFGIAKATTDQPLTNRTLFTAFEQFMGTPAYMSPEQAEMSELGIDTRSDIYSLGVLLYELLTGRTPFDAKALVGAGLDAMRRTIREQEPAPPSTRLSTLVQGELSTIAKHRHADAPKLINLIRGELDWIVMKSLEKDRARRYETANGLASDVQRHLRNEPVMAGPPSSVYRFQKMVSRNKLTFGAVACIATVLVLGVAVSAWQAVRATRAEREQSALRAEAEKARQNEAGLRQTAQTQAGRAQTEASRAEAAVTDLKMTLSATDFSQAVRLIDEDNAVDALPFLARSLSANPTNHAALIRLTTLLTYRSWMRPGLTLKHEREVGSAEFSPDGRNIVTMFEDQVRVWDARTGQPTSDPFNQGFPLVSSHFSPDGKRIVTASLDKTARIWDAQSGQPLTEPMKHSAVLTSAEFSPDGTRILTASYGETFFVWDVKTGKLLLEPVKPGNVATGEVVASSSPSAGPSPGQTNNVPTRKPARSSPNGNVYSLNIVGYANSTDGTTETFSGVPGTAHFSPDGKRIVTASSDKARIWDAQTGQALTEPIKHNGSITDVNFSPDGEQIVTSFGGTVRVWDAETGEPVTKTMKHEKGVRSAAFSPDGRRIVTVSWDNAARIWNAQTGDPLAQPMKHASDVLSAEFSPDGKRIVTASEDRTARIWDARTGQPLTEPLRHGNGVRSAHFSSDGKRIVTASADNTACVWDTQTGRPLVERLSGGSFQTIHFSPDGKRIVTASDDNTARLWDARTGQRLAVPMKHGTNKVVSAQFSPDGKMIVTASADSTARVWDAETGQPLTEPMKHRKVVSSAEFSPDSTRIVTASEDSKARIWDAQTGQPLTEFLKHSGWVVSAHFSPDGKQIITASGNRKTAPQIWDAQTGLEVKLSDFVGTLPVYVGLKSAEFSPDGKRFLTASTDKTARVWDSKTGLPLAASIKHGNHDVDLRAAHFSPDGNQIVTASDDHTARVWDAQTGQPLTEPMKHAAGVRSAQFSPDGRRIVTASSDKTVRVWDARTAQPLTDPLNHPGPVYMAEFSPDGRQIVTAAHRVAMVWDVAPAQEKFPDWLLQLSEAISGEVLNKQGVLEPTKLNRFETLNEVRRKLNQESSDNDWVVWGRWLLAGRATRTISPFSKITVPEYIENRIREKTPASLAEAEQLAADKPELLQSISEARELLRQSRK